MASDNIRRTHRVARIVGANRPSVFGSLHIPATLFENDTDGSCWVRAAFEIIIVDP